MITIIHGDDVSASRNYFLEQKLTTTNAISFDGEKLTLTDLKQIFEGGSLFSDEENIFIENFLAKPAADVVEYLSKEKLGRIVIWEEKELTKKQLSHLPKAEVKLFKIPVEIFSFLDSLAPSNGVTLMKRFHSILMQKDAEFVLFMLIRQFRLLLSMSDRTSPDSIDEVKKTSVLAKRQIGKTSRLF